MIRVCIVAPFHSVGGQATAARTLADGFGDDPEVGIDLHPIDFPLPPWVARTRGVRTLARLPLYLYRLIDKIRHADLVHVYTAAFWPFALTTTPAILLSRLLHRPVLLNYHDGRAADHLTYRWVRWVLRRASVLVFPSPFLQQQFRRFGLDGLVISNVVDTTLFRFRRRQPLRPVLISCRLLEDLYAVENTLRAFRLIRTRFPSAHLIVIGSGSRAQAIMAFAAEEGIEGVDFRGEVPHREVSAWFDRADIWVNSSREDNMPFSLIEAFSSGLPVVTTAAGGIPCIVEHERNGLLVPMDDPESMAAAVFRLFDEPGLANRIVEEARGDCRRYYAWTSARRYWLALFTRLALGHRKDLQPLVLEPIEPSIPPGQPSPEAPPRRTIPMPPA